MVDSGPESSNSSVGKVASGGLLAYLRSGVRVVVLVALLGVKKLGKRRRIVRACVHYCRAALACYGSGGGLLEDKLLRTGVLIEGWEFN